LHSLGRATSEMALLIAAASMAPCAISPGETVLVYRLRGEIRPLLFWLGRDDVGGGHIRIRQSALSSPQWRQEIEVLFGSEPDRIPRHVNRWGYGLETSDWVSEQNTPRVARTEFQGIMRHSPESSIREVTPDAGGTASGFRYNVARSVVLPAEAYHEIRIFTDSEDFYYRRPDRLLGRYRQCLAATPPLRSGRLPNDRLYAEPYGFLTALSRLLGEVVDGIRRTPDAARRSRPSVMYVFNSRPYLLAVTGIRRVASFQGRYGELRVADLAIVEFRCFNTVKRTRTDFSLWTPLAGELKGLPVKILLQPRWWLRLQLDLDPASSAVFLQPERRAAASGKERP